MGDARFTGEYPADWPAIAKATKDAAGFSGSPESGNT